MTQATDEASQREGVAGQASAKVQDAASAAQEKASELREQGSARLRDQFDQRSTQAGAQVRSLADALRRSGDDIRNEGNAGAAQLTGQAADRIERLGGYLEQKSGEELMRDIETFARRRPWMLAGLGMFVGVAAARFMKATSQQRYSDYRRTSQQWTTPGQTSGRYGRAELPSGSAVGDRPETTRAELPFERGDDPLARDPYAGTR
jgi:ElaB/YqjD/DUF883 family membrane-anchored ribosome-binding protein